MVSLAEQHLTDTAAQGRLADDSADPGGRHDHRGYPESDRAFRLALIGRLGDPTLTRFIRESRDRTGFHGNDSEAGRQRQVALAAEHRRLIELAEAGDTEEIAALIARHVRDWEPVLTAALTERLNRSRRSPGR